MNVSILNGKLIVKRNDEEYIFTKESILNMRFFSYGRFEIYTKTDELWFGVDHFGGQMSDDFKYESGKAMNWFRNHV